MMHAFSEIALNCTFCFFKCIVKYSNWAAPKFQWKKIRTELFSHPYLYSFLHQSDSFFALEFVSNYFDKCWYNFLTAFSTFWPYRGNSSRQLLSRRYRSVHYASNRFQNVAYVVKKHTWNWVSWKKWANPFDQAVDDKDLSLRWRTEFHLISRNLIS